MAEIGRSIDPLPIETVSISKICRVSRDVEVLAFDVWETARGKTGKKVSTNAREVGFEFWRMDFYTGNVIVVPSAFFFNGRDFMGSGIELKVRGRKYYFFARREKLWIAEFGEVGRNWPSSPREERIMVISIDRDDQLLS